LKNQLNTKAPKKAKRSIIILWRSFVIMLVLIAVLIFAIDKGMMGYMPKMIELENPQSALSSDVFAGDGVTILGRYYVQDRSNCKFSDISPNIIQALLATEDIRFFDHSGIDPIATVAIPFYVLMQKRRGSSTITQQLAKNLFPRDNESAFTLPFLKLKEWVLAVKLERNLTKNEILSLYLNTVPFGDNVYGIRNASLTFFNKTPDKVTIDQAAVLIGMLKGNTIYNPRSHPKRARERRNTVLEQMEKAGFVSVEQADSLQEGETPLDYHKIDYHDGIAPYFRQVLESQVRSILKDYKKPDGSQYDLYRDGLRIFTSIDVKMQRYAEEAMQEHLTELQKQFMAQSGYQDATIWTKANSNVKSILKASIKASDRYQNYIEAGLTEKQAIEAMGRPVKTKVFAWNKGHIKDTIISPLDSIRYMKTFLQAGFMAMDPFTGEVKAWVGGIDHNFFQYDHVNQNTKRQVGSTIKPILYSFAVDNGFSPCGIVSTAPQSFPTMPEPYDAGGKEKGDVPMKYALALSLNNAALYILKQVGIDGFIDYARRCGIKSKMERFPSVALGVSDISLFEMMGAYSMFPNRGINTQPYFMMRIEDKNGVVIKNFAPIQKEVINPSTAFKMVKMMKGVVDMGTGGRLRYRYGITSEVAGKTGTTNNQADAWFIGYSPQLLAGAWVGCDDREFRFRSEALGQGAAAALPIWAYFFKRVYADRTLKIDPKASFRAPEGFDDCSNGVESTPSEPEEPLEKGPSRVPPEYEPQEH
jgi:penicillin-binding protein 1A